MSPCGRFAGFLRSSPAGVAPSWFCRLLALVPRRWLCRGALLKRPHPGGAGLGAFVSGCGLHSSDIHRVYFLVTYIYETVSDVAELFLLSRKALIRPLHARAPCASRPGIAGKLRRVSGYKKRLPRGSGYTKRLPRSLRIVSSLFGIASFFLPSHRLHCVQHLLFVI